MKQNENIYISHNTVTNRRMFTGIHFHDDYEIYFLLDGNTNYFIGDEIFHIHPGSFVFIPRGILHKTDSENCLTNERFLINADISVFDNDIQNIILKLSRERVVYIAKSDMNLFKDIIYKTETEYNSHNEFRYALLRSYISELFVMIYRKKHPYKPKLSEAEEIIQNVSEYISSNFDKNLTLAALSKKFAVSACYLSRKFKAVSGIGLNEYITYVRITNAEKILKNEAVSITDTALRCGFNDSNYFSGVFKKIKGITPLKYAQDYRKSM